MLVMAFDVGMSTGAAYAELLPRKFPRLIDSKTFEMDGALDAADAFVKDRQVDMVVMELPFLTKLNDQAKKIEALRGRWVSWADVVLRQQLGASIKQISPSDWKPMPSARVNVFAQQLDTRWLTYRPTQHERDATCMLHWFATWQMDKS